MTRYHKSLGGRFAIASGCRYATATAADVLSRGGNVIDAAIAGSAVLCVTLPHAVSIGGDLFALVKTRDAGGVTALNSTGAAPRRADIATYRARGHRCVPQRGPLSIQPPGLVAGWQALSRWAAWPLARLLEPAIALARDGFAVGARLARLSKELATVCAAEQGWAETYLVGGAPIAEGGILRQPRLADTLSAVARDGARGFYRGRIAADIVRSVARAGGLIEPEDLACVAAQITPALSTAIGALTFATQPPVSQGAVLLRALRLTAAHRGAAGEDVRALWPFAARALQIAFAERVRYLGDMANSYELAQAMVDGRLAAAQPRRGLAHAGTETTTISVIDRDGNAASLIQSVFADFGSGIVTDETGILLNSRMSGFFLDEDHPNALRPGKRTMHTLHSVMVSDAEGPLLAGGSPGGDSQPQVNLQVLCRVLFGNEDIAQAAGAPRWMLFPATAPSDLLDRPEPEIRCEPDLDAETRRLFAQAGFRTAAMPRADIGSAKWVMRGEDGGLVAACDTRRDGAVRAL
jgi:gamma-glutamyltranspeptidase/glutathione hydrolase